jgi:hypothetical protein
MNIKAVAKAVIPVAAVVLTAVSSLMGKSEQKELIAKEVAKAMANKEQN